MIKGKALVPNGPELFRLDNSSYSALQGHQTGEIRKSGGIQKIYEYLPENGFLLKRRQMNDIIRSQMAAF